MSAPSESPIDPATGASAAPVPSRRTRRAREAQRTPYRAGRNLTAAITTGVILMAVIVGSLVIHPVAFVVVLAAASVVGVLELAGALRNAGLDVPMIPALAGAAGIVPAAYFGGADALGLTFAAAVMVLIAVRGLDVDERALPDTAAGVFALAYVPLMASIAALMLSQDQGVARIVAGVLCVAASDTGGYAVGVLLGRHPMAPSISPKKSWEGFAGSLVTCALMGMAAVHWLLHGPLWVGVLLGVSVCLAATLGDLAESAVKRDVGIKDMSNLLPGHGGLMDRLDSILIALPAVWCILTLGVPV